MSFANLKWILIGLAVVAGLGAGVWLSWPTLFPTAPSAPETSSSPRSSDDADSSGTGEPIACGPTMYTHDFESPDGGWYAGSGENADWSYRNDGTYRIGTAIASNVVPSWAPLDTSYLPEGFCLDVRVKEIRDGSSSADGSDGRAVALGLIFAGSSSKERFHTFDVAPSSGVFRIRKRDFAESVSTNVEDWTPTEALEDADQWNALEVRVRGERSQFYINGTRVHSASIDGSGTLGLFLESFDEADVAGLFDEFRLRELESQP